MPGLSQRQIDEHFDRVYREHVRRLNAVRQKLAGAQAGPAWHALKRQEAAARNAVVLHELYFENLGSDRPPTGRIQELLVRDFGSVSRYLDDLRASGMAARAWVVTGWDVDVRRLQNFISDDDSEAAWNGYPLLVLDVRAHAYGVDHGDRRDAYLKAFARNIKWDAVNARLQRHWIPT